MQAIRCGRRAPAHWRSRGLALPYSMAPGAGLRVVSAAMLRRESSWLDIEVERAGLEVRMGARGSRAETITMRSLGPEITVERLVRFAARVRDAALKGQALGAALLDEDHAIHEAVLAPDIAGVFKGLRDAARGAPVLVRLLVADPELQQVPWEALCAPGTSLGFWGTSPALYPARGVISRDPWLPREVSGALRVLVVHPSEVDSAARIRSALAERIAAGEVEWLEPIGPDQARLPYLFDRLRREPIPHVLHFVGHGGSEGGKSVLRLADDADGDPVWLPVELFAQQLEASFNKLRLVVLEACEGGRPGTFASAAELLGRSGADAVIAYLWPVRADVARTCSEQLYRVLAGADRGEGNAAVALNEARRTTLGTYGSSAEALSAVLYLRGQDPALFDFSRRKVLPPAPLPPPGPGSAAMAVDPALVRLLRSPFSLVLGDLWQHDRQALDGFCAKLYKELEKSQDPAPSGLSPSALAQRFAQRKGLDRLGSEFQRAFRAGVDIPPLFRGLARQLSPGVHVTLLRSPLLERALCEEKPDTTLWVIQPGEESIEWLRREAGKGEDAWEAVEPPGSLELDKAMTVLRLYRGYTPEQVFTAPLLTEDDYLFAFRDVETALPRDLADEILGGLGMRPALVTGLSLLAWHHRVLLHRLFGKRPLPRGSMAVVEPGERERELWEKGASLPGKGGIMAVEMAAAELEGALSTLAMAAATDAH
jgi:hypothetical protein